MRIRVLALLAVTLAACAHTTPPQTRTFILGVKALYDNHIPIVAGTDAMAGFSLHRELQIYAMRCLR